MASYDRLTGDYYIDTITGPQGAGDIYVTVGGGQKTVFINGNLVVIGTFTRVETVDTYIYDNIITLNADITGAPFEDSGLEIGRGTSPNVYLKWNETIDWWEFSASHPNRYVTSTRNDASNDTFMLYKILRFLRDDPDPHLGGHMYTDGYEIRSQDPYNIIFTPGWNGTAANTGIQINHVNSLVANIPYVQNSTIVFAKEPGNGVSGLYIIDKKQRQEELVTKRRAVVYSLVL